MKQQVTFRGVRGSIPAPGAATATVGGNTSCVEVRLGKERIVLDGGSGLRPLAMARQSRPLAATVLISHLHWDHIQGIPFFVPLYQARSQFRVIGPQGLRVALERQMSRPNFPVGMDALKAEIEFCEIEPGAAFRIGAVHVRTAALNHPGGAIGFRLEHAGCVVTSGLDHEHGDDQADRRLVDLACGADLLIYDAQYLPEEYPDRVGWGHSTWDQAVAVARQAGVRCLALAHHDPARSDEQVAAMERAARARFRGAFAAREGCTLELKPVEPACRTLGEEPRLATVGPHH